MKKGRVCMALSGGVDSAVSAALLLEEGYDVHAVFIKVWQPDFLDCTQEDDRKSAKRVAASLGIPFEVLDAADAYKARVIDVMVQGYAVGRTPNPDILCNQHIKFGILAEYAARNGFEYIATGHYAQIVQYEGVPCLKKANDPQKDQVYFLSQVAPHILGKCIFPVGSILKSETRALAEKYMLPVFDKKDSQGLCFMGMVDMAEFLSHAITLSEGVVLNAEGVAIGTHGGAQQFTRGQRHGFVLKTPTSTPHYVTAVDVEHNTITVSDKYIGEQEVIVLESVIAYGPLKAAQTYDVQVRYHGAVTSGTLMTSAAHSLSVRLTSPVIVAPGQVVVLYDGDVLIASGIACV